MALFSKKKDKVSLPGAITEIDAILGYMDELFTQRSPITIRTKDKEWDCSIYFLDVDKKRMRIEDSYGLLENNGKAVQCGFPMDRTFYMFSSKIEFFDGKPHLRLPPAIKQIDRRKSSRVSFSPREEVAVTVLQSLGAGLGFTGSATDISAGGVCLSIERGMNLQSQKDITVRNDMLPKDTALMVVKVAKVPGVPTFQAEGKVNRFMGSGRYKLVVEFTKIPGKFKEAIQKFVDGRYHKPIPTRKSYKKRKEMQRQREEEMQQQEADARQARASQAANADPEPSGEAPKKEISFVKMDDIAPDFSFDEPVAEEAPVEDVPAEDVPAEEAPAEPLKPVLVSLGDHLQEQLGFLGDVPGYKWVHVNSPLKILKLLREHKSGSLFIPLSFKRQSMLEYLEKITGSGAMDNIGIIILAEEPLAPKELIKCRMLKIQHILQLPIENPDKVLEMLDSH